MTPLRRRLLSSALGLAAVVVAVAVADSERRVVDLTEDRVLTLSGQTREVVGAVDRDIDVTLFARPSDPGRVEAVSLLDRYRRLSDRIEVDVVDPDASPGEVTRAGVDPLLGGVVLRSGDRVEQVPFATEGDLTGAMARLLRDRASVACLTTGHGERSRADTTGAGLSEAAALLERDGHEVREIDLLADPEVPVGCTVVVMAALTGQLADRAERSLGRWVADDGRLLLLTDPVSTASPLRDRLADHGLRVERGIVLEGDTANVVGGDVAAPIVDRYRSGNPVGRGLAPTFFPGVQEVAVDDEVDVAGLTVARIAETSDVSYLERNPVEAEFDPTDDRPGPVTVVGSADRSRVDGADVRRTRIVVTGDVDFATNEFLAEAGNAQLLRQAVAWLTQTEDLVAISPNLPRDRPLAFTDARATYTRVLSIGVVPGLFLLAGAMVWAVRRGR
jgi:ABC-type uncharacterized transport system involved in gliding motility auxiliary subunit